MGTININIASKVLTTPPGSGQVGIDVVMNLECDSHWKFNAKTSTTAWIEFDIPANCIITKTTPAGVFVNGETITDTPEFWEWSFEIVGFVSRNAVLNTQLTTVVARLYDAEGGTLIDTATVDHYHTMIIC